MWNNIENFLDTNKKKYKYSFQLVRSNSAAAAPEKLLGCWEAEIYDLATNSNCDDDEIRGDTFLPKVEPCTISFVVDLLFFQEQFFLRYTLIWRNLPLSIFQLSLSAFFQTHKLNSSVSSLKCAYCLSTSFSRQICLLFNYYAFSTTNISC